MTRSSIRIALALPLLALGCEGGPPSGTAATSSAAPPKTTAAATARPTATAAAATATAASSADAKPASTSTSAAASFPATALPSKNFAEFTIGLPPGGKLEKEGEDRSSLDTADYKLILKIAAKTDDLTKIKTGIQKMTGFKSLTVDQPDGLIAEGEAKGQPQFMLTRHVKVGDVTVSCDSAMTKPPKDKVKAQEAFDVCGTIKKK